MAEGPTIRGSTTLVADAASLARAPRTSADEMTSAELEELFRREQERTAQIEAYASDLSRTYAELRRSLNRMAVLHEVNTQVAALLDPQDVIETMLQSLSRLVAYSQALVYLADPPTPEFPVAAGVPRLRAGWTALGNAAPDLLSLNPPSDAVVLAAFRSEKATHRLVEGGVELAFPLRAVGGQFGVMVVRRDLVLTEDEQRVVELLAAHTSVVLQNALIFQAARQLANVDPLTQIGNRRQFHQSLQLEEERARRLGYPLGMVMLDLDYFKSINDRHGHAVGDAVLRDVAHLLHTRIRRTDVVGRLGGEEFGVLLPGASLVTVARVAEKLRQGVEELPPAAGGMDPRLSTAITISAGGASYVPEKTDKSKLLVESDRALFQAKSDGRNLVRLWWKGAAVAPRQIEAPGKRR